MLSATDPSPWIQKGFDIKHTLSYPAFCVPVWREELLLCSQNFPDFGILASSPNFKTSCRKRATMRRRQIFLNKWKVEWKVRQKPLQTCIQGWILWMKVDNCAEECISMWNSKCGFTERGSTFLLEMQYFWSLLEVLKSLSTLSSRILEAGVICLINSSKENNNKWTLCLFYLYLSGSNFALRRIHWSEAQWRTTEHFKGFMQH